MTTLAAGTAAPAPAPEPRRRGGWLALLALAGTLAFAALAVWQFQRLGWKHALIERVEQQLAAAPQPLPAPATWPTLQREADEYRRLTVTARFDPVREVRVLASTELGRGQWLMVPAQLADGRWLWVNRGFVPEAPGNGQRVGTPTEAQPLSGLLRWSEPKGWLWQHNDPAAGRWVSRDVAALSQAAGLPTDRVAPFFVDLAAAPGAAADAYPRAGLTVVRFSNNHLVYALTWLALAAGSAAALLWLWRTGHAPPDA